MKTRRLVVRPLVLGDYRAWKNAYTGMLPPRNAWDRSHRHPDDMSVAQFKKALSSQRKLLEQDRFYDLAVFRRDTGEMIGTIGIMDVNRGLGQSAYLGYRIFNRHWSQGYGKEAVTAGIEIAFRQLKLHRVEAGVEPTNRRSILLARSLGLRKEGLKKRAVFLRGKWLDLVVYAATCEEWGIPWKGKTSIRPR